MLDFLRKLFSSIQGLKSVIDYKGYKNKFTNYMNMVRDFVKQKIPLISIINLIFQSNISMPITQILNITARSTIASNKIIIFT